MLGQDAATVAHIGHVAVPCLAQAAEDHEYDRPQPGGSPGATTATLQTVCLPEACMSPPITGKRQGRSPKILLAVESDGSPQIVAECRGR